MVQTAPEPSVARHTTSATTGLARLVDLLGSGPDTCDPVAVVEALRATDDAELAAVLADPSTRALAVSAVLDRLHEYAIGERVRALRGTMLVDLDDERHALDFTERGLSVRHDLRPDAVADVVLRTDAVLLLRLVSGERNAGLEYLAGRLDILGDCDLALAVGGIFTVPGTTDVAVDPRALDPVDVATVLGTVSPAHLSAVMASGFRDVVIGEIFRRLPDFVNHRKARKARLEIGFRLLGRPDGEIERYVVHVADGEVRVVAGEGSEHRDATISCDAVDFVRLATGHLSAIKGVMRGQLKVRGDRAKALQLSALLDIPSAR